jgi:tetratricopeptide (TPR) repeat protein
MFIIFICQLTKQDSAKMWFSVAHDYFQKQQYKSAIDNFKRALTYDDKFEPAYLEMALSYMALNEVDSAINVYQTFTKLFPNKVEGYQGLGYIYGFIKKDYEKSIENYKKVLSIEPQNQNALKLLVQVYEKSNNLSEAESLYTSLIEKDPNNKNTMKSYIILLSKLNKDKQASDYIEKFYQMDSTDKDILVLGFNINASLSKKEPVIYKTRYLKYLEKLFSLEPNNTDYLNAIVDEAINDREYKKAINYLENYLKNNENSSVYLKLAVIYLENLKNYTRAEELLNKAITVAQREGSTLNLAFAYANLGDIYLDRAQNLANDEKYNEALKLYDTSISYYNKALENASGNLKNYVSNQLDRAKKLKQVSWRKAHNIE